MSLLILMCGNMWGVDAYVWLLTAQNAVFAALDDVFNYSKT